MTPPSLFSSWQELKQESSGCVESVLGLNGIISGWTGCQKHSLISLHNTHMSALCCTAKMLSKQYFSSLKLSKLFFSLQDRLPSISHSTNCFLLACHLPFKDKSWGQQIKKMRRKGSKEIRSSEEIKKGLALRKHKHCSRRKKTPRHCLEKEANS